MRIHHATLAKAKKFQITLAIEDNEVVATAKDGTRLASGLQGNKVLEDAITKLTGKPAKTGAEKKAATATATATATAKPARKSRRQVEEDEDGDEEETGEESEALAGEGDAEDESDAEQGGSVVKHKYKVKYKEHGGTCGDEIALRLSEHVAGKDGNVDRTKLERFARANDAWKPMYGSFKTKSGGWNGGLARMNVSNILRGRQRRAVAEGEKFEIDWV